MDEFKSKLENITDSYYGFVAGVLTYVKKSEKRLDIVNKFMEDNPYALSSDILSFISEQGDFYDDEVPSYAEVG